MKVTRALCTSAFPLIIPNSKSSLWRKNRNSTNSPLRWAVDLSPAPSLSHPQTATAPVRSDSQTFLCTSVHFVLIALPGHRLCFPLRLFVWLQAGSRKNNSRIIVKLLSKMEIGSTDKSLMLSLSETYYSPTILLFYFCFCFFY